MLAAADLFLGFSTSFEQVYALAPPARSTSTSATLPTATTPRAAASEVPPLLPCFANLCLQYLHPDVDCWCVLDSLPLAAAAHPRRSLPPLLCKMLPLVLFRLCSIACCLWIVRFRWCSISCVLNDQSTLDDVFCTNIILFQSITRVLYQYHDYAPNILPLVVHSIWYHQLYYHLP